MHAPEAQEEFKPPDTQPCGSRGCPPRWPPAPPGTGEAGPPSGGSPSDGWPFRSRMIWDKGAYPGLRSTSRIPWLADPLEQGVSDLTIVHTVLSAIAAIKAFDPGPTETLEIDTRLELAFQEAHKRLMARVSELEAQLQDMPPEDDLYTCKAGVLAWAARAHDARSLDHVVGCAAETPYDPPHPDYGDRLPSTFRYTLHADRPLVELACLKPALFLKAVLADLRASLAALNASSHPMVFAAGVRRKYAALLLAAGVEKAVREDTSSGEDPKLEALDAALLASAAGSFSGPFEGFVRIVSVMRRVLEALETFPEEASLVEELHRALSGSRAFLLKQLQTLEQQVSQPAKSGFLEADLRRFKTAMLLLLGWGVEREKLADGDGGAGPPVEGKDGADTQDQDRYIYRMRSGMPFTRVFGVAPWVVALWAIADLRGEVLDDQNFTSRAEFERDISQKFQAWRLAARGELLDPEGATSAGPDEPDLQQTGEQDEPGE